MTVFPVDAVDQKIINLLLENSRLSYRQIAKKAGVSTATVLNRIRALEGNGIIKRYTALIDYEAIGFEFDVVIEVRVSHGKLHDVEKRIAAVSNVIAVYDATGDFDITVIARFKTRRQLDAFVKKLQTFDFVERTLTKLVLKTIKEEPMQI